MRIDPSTATRAEQNRLLAGWEALRRRVLPSDWSETEDFAQGARYRSRDGLRVIVTIELVDKELWLHASFSRRDRVPSWQDTRRVKDVFIGSDRKAIIVLPKDSEYYNLHEHCLHLYSSLDRDPLPDFRDELGRL